MVFLSVHAIPVNLSPWGFLPPARPRGVCTTSRAARLSAGGCARSREGEVRSREGEVVRPREENDESGEAGPCGPCAGGEREGTRRGAGGEEG